MGGDRVFFGHAPIIFPSVLRVPVACRPAFYVHLALLHVSLAGRTVADLAALPGLCRWGAMINAAARLSIIPRCVERLMEYTIGGRIPSTVRTIVDGGSGPAPGSFAC